MKMLDEKIDILEGGDDGWRRDGSVPAGWKYKYNPANKKTTVLDSTGRRFDGRRKALLHLLSTGQSVDLVMVLDQGLASEGWSCSENLPDGWKWKYRGSPTGKRIRTLYLTDTYDLIESDGGAVKYIEKNYDQDSLLSFQSFTRNHIKGGVKDVAPVNNLPKDWELIENGKIKAPDGKTYKSRRLALREMITSGLFTKLEVDQMRSCLKLEGWRQSPDIPSGWMTKTRNGKVLFITSDGDLFESITSASRFVEKYQKYFLPDDISKIELLNRQRSCTREEGGGRRGKVGSETKVRRKEIRVKEEKSSSSSGELPTGWEVRDCKSRNKIFVSPTGQKLNGISSALRMMVRESYSEEEVSQMRNYSLRLGWRRDPTLPFNWFLKKGEKSTRYMGPSGEFFRRKEEVMQHLQTDSNGPDVKKTEEVESAPSLKRTLKAESDLKPRAKRIRKDRNLESWSESDGTIPEGWMFRTSKTRLQLLSPEGQVIIGRRCALKFMNDNNYPVESIMEIRNFLIDHDDWNSDEKLPSNWLYKVSCKETVYCSPTGERFRQKEKALHFLKCQGASDEDINLLRTFTLAAPPDDSWSYGDASVPQGWRMKEARIGVRKYTQLFSPCGRKIKGRRAALSFMMDHMYPETSIEVMRRGIIDHEGWQRDERLPENWLVKVTGRVIYFCSDSGKLFESREKAVQYLRRESAPPADIEKVSQYKISRSSEDDQLLTETEPTNITEFSMNDSNLESDVSEDEVSYESDVSITEDEIFIDDENFGVESEDEITIEDEATEETSLDEIVVDSSPDSLPVSQKLRGRKLYQNYSDCLLEENLPLLDSLKAELFELGWVEAPDLLPDFWLMRLRSGRKMNFLTPAGNILKTKADAKNYVAKSGEEFHFDFVKLRERLNDV